MKKILLLNVGLIFFSALHAQDKINFGVVTNPRSSASRAADSMRKILVIKDTTTVKRRSEIKDAHDRYGTQDTSYLQIKAPPKAVDPKKVLPKRAASPVKQ